MAHVEDGKTEQLQIRVSPSQKRAIKERAEGAGMTMSDWVLSRVLSSARASFQGLLEDLSSSAQPSYVFAELLEFLGSLSTEAYPSAVSEPPAARLDPYWENYVAATVEHAAAMKDVPPPAWTADVPPLDEPVFGSSLQSLRWYLLTHSPPAFRRRNIFIDASVGDRV
jgi:hypothetical protein